MIIVINELNTCTYENTICTPEDVKYTCIAYNTHILAYTLKFFNWQRFALQGSLILSANLPSE